MTLLANLVYVWHEQEYEVAEEEGLSAAERLARQRRSLNKRMGLGGQMDTLLDTSNLVKDEDLLGRCGGSKQAAPPGKADGSGAKQKAPSELLSEMSAAGPADMAGALHMPSLTLHLEPVCPPVAKSSAELYSCTAGHALGFNDPQGIETPQGAQAKAFQSDAIAMQHPAYTTKLSALYCNGCN